MKNIFIAIISCSLFFVSCEEESNTQKTVNGYDVEWLKKGTGKKAQEGDMTASHIYFYMDGKMQNSTRESGRTAPIKVSSVEELNKMKESGKPNPLFEAIALMSVGDSVKVNVPITEEMRQDPRMKEAKEMTYHVVMESAQTEAEFTAERAAEQEKAQALAAATLERAPEVATLAKDIAKQYSSGQLNDKIKKTDSGLKYMIMEEGTGELKAAGEKIEVHYYGMLTNGEMFDNSFDRGQPISFPLGQGRVIRGWDEGLQLMKAGSRGVLFIPSDLGYGAGGSPPKIPGDSELIFYVEVL